MLCETQPLNCPSGQVATLEDLVLGLVVIHRPHVDGEDLLEIYNLRILDVDLDRRRPSVEGLHREAFDGCKDHRDQKYGNDHPPSFPDDPPVITKMDLLLFLLRKIGIAGGWRELIIFVRGNWPHTVLLTKPLGIRRYDP